MCVVALAHLAHPRWKLVVAGNRDELHARPSAPLARWNDAPEIIAGRDLVSGGGWIGVSDAGRFAVVTNVAGNPPDPAKRSRGALVADYLRNGVRPVDPSTFNPFNLFTIGHGAGMLHSNRPQSMARALTPGIHSLSNGEADAPWARRDALESAFAGWLERDNPDVEGLFAMLADESPTHDPGHPPVFIRAPIYGTRACTVVTVDMDGTGEIIERGFGADGIPLGEARAAFRWGD